MPLLERGGDWERAGDVLARLERHEEARERYAPFFPGRPCSQSAIEKAIAEKTSAR